MGQGSSLTHPLRMMIMMAPSRRMRTARPPAQMPRMSPISSDLWDTSKGCLLSLQAAGGEQSKTKDQRRDRDPPSAPPPPACRGLSSKE